MVAAALFMLVFPPFLFFSSNQFIAFTDTSSSQKYHRTITEVKSIESSSRRIFQ
jgi:hypothetical protein